MKTYGSWGTKINLENVNFNNYGSATTQKCGNKHTAIQRNSAASDYIPVHKFVKTTFRDVSDAAVIYLEDPSPDWATLSNCIEWPCTAPENVVLHFEQTIWTGSFMPVRPVQDF